MPPLIRDTLYGGGDNGLMGVGASKNDVSFQAARGLASEPARAIGAPATEPLNEVFSLSSAGQTISLTCQSMVLAVSLKYQVETMLDLLWLQNCKPELTRFLTVKRAKWLAV